MYKFSAFCDKIYFFAPLRALVYLMLNVGFSILNLKEIYYLFLQSRVARIEYLGLYAQTLMPMIFLSLVPACPVWDLQTHTVSAIQSNL